VQIAKRHRDRFFEQRDAAVAPISVVITTLAAQSYEWSVMIDEYNAELDLLRDVVRRMPRFIERSNVGGQTQWAIPNETTAGENFAEKWNQNSALADAFFEWHAKLTTDLDALTDVEGLDRLAESLRPALGPEPVSKAMADFERQISSGRSAQQLWVAPTIGLSLTEGSGTRVLANTHYGAS
jgi:hypothetical protein